MLYSFRKHLLLNGITLWTAYVFYTYLGEGRVINFSMTLPQIEWKMLVYGQIRFIHIDPTLLHYPRAMVIRHE